VGALNLSVNDHVNYLKKTPSACTEPSCCWPGKPTWL